MDSFLEILLISAVAVPFAAGAGFFALGESRGRARAVVGILAGLLATASSVGVMSSVALGPAAPSVGFAFLGARLGIAADGLGALFAVVACTLWLVTTVYATGYMSHARDRARFFGFFAICVGSAVGIALSANLLTLFIFYEALTLATYPLVVHSGTPAALRGGRTYLYYALGGGAALALGVMWLYAIGGGGDFGVGGILPAGMDAGQAPALVAIFVLLMIGFGVKAALFPAHGWLPAAMVAPAPVSALLHAVAVVKAGVFGIARVVLFVYGPELATDLGVLVPLAGLAGFTLLFASVKALAHDDIKKRLAFSTIGQLSYIVLGIAIGTPVAAAAAIAHLAHHALLKITMFFTAGVLAEELKVYRVSRMDGVGRRMPVTMTAFTVAALGIIGVPPIAGFVSKWGLGLGGLEGGLAWPMVALAVSSILNAAYFLPMIARAWFRPAPDAWPNGEDGRAARRGFEGDRRMVWPLMLTAAAGFALGPLAGLPWSPASLAAAITGAPAKLIVPWRIDGLELDAVGTALLPLVVVCWLAAALSARPVAGWERKRFWVFFALCATGSLGLVWARDPALFYTCFSVMALSAYGLIAHDDTREARQAARTYLAFTVIGEALLLMGVLVGSNGAATFSEVLLGSEWFVLGTTALLIAFLMKIGAVGLGGWMPCAYAEAPPGVAVAVAGVVTSTGIVGMARLLPGGTVDLALWGGALVVIGLAGAFLGVLAGSVQTRSRHVLAYSSTSQFGLMTAGIGVGLMSAELWAAACAAVAVYLVHHGLAKAALFAGDDALQAAGRHRTLVAALAVSALALAGLPFTSGAIAKVALKSVVGDAPEAWAHSLETLMSLAAVGTALVMARFLVVSISNSPATATSRTIARTRVAVLWMLTAFVVGYLWLVRPDVAAYSSHKSLTPYYLWALAWPIALGAALAAGAWALRRTRAAAVLGAIPPGDVWAPVLSRVHRVWEAYDARLAADMPPKAEVPDAGLSNDRALLQRAERAEARLISWPIASAVLVSLAVVVLLLAR